MIIDRPAVHPNGATCDGSMLGGPSRRIAPVFPPMPMPFSPPRSPLSPPRSGRLQGRAAVVALLAAAVCMQSAGALAQPTAVQRWFRSDLPQPAPNPFGVPVAAGVARSFPEKSLLGSMTPGIFPQVSINGTPMRFAAGALIRNQLNLVVSPATLAGAAWPVRYVLDPAGQIVLAWILTDAELAAEANRPRAAATTAAAPATSP